MAKDAHFVSASEGTSGRLTVRDDRGIPITELELPPSVTDPAGADEELRKAGWVRGADWAVVDDGWIAPVRNEDEE